MRKLIDTSLTSQMIHQFQVSMCSLTEKPLGHLMKTIKHTIENGKYTQNITVSFHSLTERKLTVHSEISKIKKILKITVNFSEKNFYN